MDLSSMNIVVNGEPKSVPDDLTVLGLLALLQLDPARLAIELDRNIIKQGEWSATPLHEGTRLEIVQFVGGG